MRWLVEDCRPGDSLVFHYSGHGSQEEDIDGDEIDGYDETICPLDYKTNGMIIDDEINYTIVRPLPRGVKLHAIIDACHSGTVLDLPYLCRMNRFVLLWWRLNHHRSSSQSDMKIWHKFTGTVGMNGRIIDREPACGKVQMVDKCSPSVAATITKYLPTQRWLVVVIRIYKQPIKFLLQLSNFVCLIKYLIFRIFQKQRQQVQWLILSFKQSNVEKRRLMEVYSLQCEQWLDTHIIREVRNIDCRHYCVDLCSDWQEPTLIRCAPHF